MTLKEQIKCIAETLTDCEGQTYNVMYGEKNGAVNLLTNKQINKRNPICFIYSRTNGKIKTEQGIYRQSKSFLFVLVKKSTIENADKIVQEQVEAGKILFDKITEEIPNVLTNEINYSEGTEQFGQDYSGILFEIEIETGGKTIC